MIFQRNVFMYIQSEHCSRQSIQYHHTLTHVCVFVVHRVACLSVHCVHLYYILFLQCKKKQTAIEKTFNLFFVVFFLLILFLCCLFFSRLLYFIFDLYLFQSIRQRQVIPVEYTLDNTQSAKWASAG